MSVGASLPLMVTQGLRFLLNHAPPSLLLGVISKNGAVPLEASATAGAGQESSLIAPKSLDIHSSQGSEQDQKLF